MIDDSVTLLINGMRYGGWISLKFDRCIDKMVSSASLVITERWAAASAPWPIHRWDAAVLFIGADVVLTGYVDDVSPSYDKDSHSVGVSIRSRTQDLVDCTPDFPSGQFRGYTLAAIAAATTALFGIEALVMTDASQTFPDASLQRCETAFTFLERLGRLAGVLLTDNGAGNLVLTTAGASRAAGALIEGVNIEAASAKLSSDGRFSIYIVKGQRALGSTQSTWDEAGDDDAAAVTPVATSLRATASDITVPRYRPHVSIAEAQLDDAGMQRRANWERNYAIGRSTEATITVQGFRQPDGTLWQENQLVTVTSPLLQIDQDLLIAGVTHTLDSDKGRQTHLKLGPIEGYTPDPGEVKIHSKHGRKGRGGPDWCGAGGI